MWARISFQSTLFLSLLLLSRFYFVAKHWPSANIIMNPMPKNWARAFVVWKQPLAKIQYDIQFPICLFNTIYLRRGLSWLYVFVCGVCVLLHFIIRIVWKIEKWNCATWANIALLSKCVMKYDQNGQQRHQQQQQHCKISYCTSFIIFPAFFCSSPHHRINTKQWWRENHFQMNCVYLKKIV